MEDNLALNITKNVVNNNVLDNNNIPFVYQTFILNASPLVVRGLYPFIVLFVTYWIANIPFIYYQFKKQQSGKNNKIIQWLDKFTIRPDKQVIDHDYYLHIIKSVFLTQTCVFLPLSLLESVIFENRFSLDYDEFFTMNYILSVPIYLLLFIISDEILFYTSHYYMHKIKFLYNNIHYKHHEMKHSVSVGCIYTHPIEFIFANILPVLAGPFFLRPHITIYWLWICLKMLETIYVHSGFEFFNFNFFVESSRHDYHHSHYRDNYGSWLHSFDRFLTKTNSNFEAFKNEKKMK
ncbi:hypothetical protein ABK040_013460 [Willaertia magna]